MWIEVKKENSWSTNTMKKLMSSFEDDHSEMDQEKHTYTFTRIIHYCVLFISLITSIYLMITAFMRELTTLEKVAMLLAFTILIFITTTPRSGDDDG